MGMRNRIECIVQEFQQDEIDQGTAVAGIASILDIDQDDHEAIDAALDEEGTPEEIASLIGDEFGFDDEDEDEID